jgi:hypothetical protein
VRVTTRKYSPACPTQVHPFKAGLWSEQHTACVARPKDAPTLPTICQKLFAGPGPIIRFLRPNRMHPNKPTVCADATCSCHTTAVIRQLCDAATEVLPHALMDPSSKSSCKHRRRAGISSYPMSQQQAFCLCASAVWLSCAVGLNTYHGIIQAAAMGHQTPAFNAGKCTAVIRKYAQVGIGITMADCHATTSHFISVKQSCCCWTTACMQPTQLDTIVMCV